MSPNVIFGLCIALFLSLTANFALAQSVRLEHAKNAPLREAVSESSRVAIGYQLALTSCENSKEAMRSANDKAVRAAQRKESEAATGAEKFERKLANPLPDTCAAIRAVKVCPELMDY